MADLITAVTTACTTVSTNVLSLLGDIVPVALTIVGAVLVVTIGVKVFKRIAGK